MVLLSSVARVLSGAELVSLAERNESGKAIKGGDTRLTGDINGLSRLDSSRVWPHTVELLTVGRRKSQPEHNTSPVDDETDLWSSCLDFESDWLGIMVVYCQYLLD